MYRNLKDKRSQCNSSYSRLQKLSKTCLAAPTLICYTLITLVLGAQEEKDCFLKEGYVILGYCRASKTTKSKIKVIHSLQKRMSSTSNFALSKAGLSLQRVMLLNMITGLKIRSSVDQVHAGAKTHLNSS